MEGWIKLHRQLLNWEWYDDHNTFRLFIFMLLKANHKEGKWRGNEIKKGCFISSINNLSAETGLTVKQVRTSINKLKRTNEVASKSHSKFTVFQIVNYDTYQQEGKQKDNEEASRGQAEGKERATNKNVNNNKKDNNTITNSQEAIDYNKLLDFLNKTFKKKCTAFSDILKGDYRKRLKEGYTKEHILKAMINASKDQFHIDTNYKHCTIGYFSKVKTLDIHGFQSEKINSYIPTK